MNRLQKALLEMSELDRLTAMDSPVHRLSPLAKLLVTIVYIVVTVSFGKYDLSRLVVMVLYPVLAFSLSGIPVSTCFYKLRIAIPLVIFVGLFNPLFDKAPLLHIGNVAVSGGVVSMLTLVLKGIFSLMASFILVATTPIDRICAALRKLHVPSMLVTLLLLTFRYAGVMMQEAAVMSDAYRLRAPGQKGVHISAWGSFLGQLFLRSMDRAQEVYAAMRLRGFHGEFPHADAPSWRGADTVFCLVCAVLLILFRRYALAELLGQVVL